VRSSHFPWGLWDGVVLGADNPSGGGRQLRRGTRQRTRARRVRSLLIPSTHNISYRGPQPPEPLQSLTSRGPLKLQKSPKGRAHLSSLNFRNLVLLEPEIPQKAQPEAVARMAEGPGGRSRQTKARESCERQAGVGWLGFLRGRPEY